MFTVSLSLGVGQGAPKKSASVYLDTLATLQGVIEQENAFQILLGSELGPHKLMKRARVLADYRRATGDVRPTQLVAVSFLIAQEWANQMGEKVLLTVELGMGAPPISLFYPHRQKHLAYREPSPLSESTAWCWWTFPPSERFLPMNCALCPTFVPAKEVISFTKDGVRLIVPSCEAHMGGVQQRYQ